jgi:hypothetical protein
VLQLSNLTPFAAQRCLTIDKEGDPVWVVTIKATFDLHADGTVEFCKEQEPVQLAPVFAGDPGRSSLLRDSEMVFAHPGTDVIVNGTAYAPYQAPTNRVVVSLQAGELEKSVVVYGNRSYKKTIGGVRISPPEDFLTIPLDFEHTFGGLKKSQDGSVIEIDDRNPAGRGFFDSEGLAPNIENPKKSKEPAGFGAIPSGWSPRRLLAGTFDDLWRRERMPYWPRDFDSRYFCSVDTDQNSPTHFRGGEQITLNNFTPNGRLSFSLPKHRFIILTHIRESIQRHRPELDRVIIEPDQHKLLLVWRSSYHCGPFGREIKKSVVDELKVNER